jgi:hypothetical protein
MPDKNIWISLGFLLAVIVILGVLYTHKPAVAPGLLTDTATTTTQASITYSNTEYGFSMSLPQSWQGYTIASSTWQGLSIGGTAGEKVVTSGPTVLIRHPLWTAANPRQDIPVMVFTIPQWNELQAEKYHIGAAPIGPTELGSNSLYVFALPARYNYAFQTGYEEVDRIVTGGNFTFSDPQ